MLTRHGWQMEIRWLPFDGSGERVHLVTKPHDRWSEFEETVALTSIAPSVRSATRLRLSSANGSEVTATYEEEAPGNSRLHQWWPKCAEPECLGEAADANGRCYVHADDAFRETYLSQLKEGRPLEGLRGVNLSNELTKEIISSVPRAHSEVSNRLVPVFSAVDLSWCTLDNFDVQYAGFQGPANFFACTFTGEALFGGCQFQDSCDFRSAVFHRTTMFSYVRSRRYIIFDRAEFREPVTFVGSNFEAESSFARVRFRTATFNQDRFADDANFTHALFAGPHTRFDAIDISGRARFDDAIFYGDVTFDGTSYPPWGPAIFGGSAEFERVRATGSLNLSHVSFPQGLQLSNSRCDTLALRNGKFVTPQAWSLAAQCLDLTRATFETGGIIQVAGADVVLEEAHAAAPLVVTASDTSPLPRIVSIKRARVGEFVFGEVDLRKCRFFGAHQLASLQIEPGASFRQIPRSLRLTNRAIIQEECDWRLATKPNRWSVVRYDEGSPENQAEPRTPSDIASVYRALRKGREDSGDAPGAADFYYGEMEMRRHDGDRPAAERAVVLLYWLFSGYGLRASRAFLGLLLVVALGSLALWAWGFHSHVTFSHASRIAVESTSSLFRLQGESGRELTHIGVISEWALRWLGPLFIGLIFFSLRGRVKR